MGSIELIGVSYNLQTHTDTLSESKENQNCFHKAAWKAHLLIRILPVTVG